MPTQYVQCDIYSGAVLEREYYPKPPQVRNMVQYNPLCPRRDKTPEQKAKARERQSLQRLTRIVNTNFSPTSYYCTLTFDDTHYPTSYAELRHTRDKYIRRLREACPSMKAVFVMGRGRQNARFHLHALVDGTNAETIAAKWEGGAIKRIEPLRKHNWYNGVNHGQDYSGLARYLFEHFEEEQGKGKRWYQTKSLAQPERESPTIPDTVPTSDYPPPPPPYYKLVGVTVFEIPTGRFLRFKYVLTTAPPCRPCIVPRFTT